MNATPTSIQVLSVPNLEFHITPSSVSPAPLSCDMDELSSEMTLCYCHPVFLIDQIQHISALPIRCQEDGRKAAVEFDILS